MSPTRPFAWVSATLVALAWFVACVAAEPPNLHTVEVKGVKIRYLDQGAGDPVVLIHGLHSTPEMNWGLNGIIADLAKDHRVIAVDLPGHGRSDKPDKEDAYGLQLVEDMVALLDQAKIKKAQFVGYSLGGMIVAKMLATHPERVSAALLGGMGWLKEGSGLQKVWGKMKAREGARTPAAFTQSIGKLALTEEELKKIDIPVEIVVGDRDPVKRLYVTPLQQTRNDWPVVEIAGAGHIECVLKKQFRDEVGKWVRKNTK